MTEAERNIEEFIKLPKELQEDSMRYSERFPNDYTDFNNEMAELVEEQASYNPMIISYSEAFRWDTCHRQYWYRFGRNLAPLEESPAMVRGTKGHKLLQSFYTAYSEFIAEGVPPHIAKIKARDITQNRAAKMAAADLDPVLLKAWILTDNYIMEHEFSAEAVLIENRFLLPFSKLDDDPNYADIQIGFTPDVVFRRTGGFMDVEDSKFVEKAWPQKKINRFQQAKLYQMFLKHMGYNVSRSTIRFFNVTTGKITHQNYSMGAVEAYNIMGDFIQVVKEIADFRRSNPDGSTSRRTHNYTTCQFCPFEAPCTMEAEGKSAEKTFKHLYKLSDYSYDS